MEEDKNLNKLTPEDVHNLKMDPPANAWSALESRLDKGPVPVQKPSYMNMRRAAMLVLLLISSFVAWHFLAPNQVVQHPENKVKNTTAEVHQTNVPDQTKNVEKVVSSNQEMQKISTPAISSVENKSESPAVNKEKQRSIPAGNKSTVNKISKAENSKSVRAGTGTHALVKHSLAPDQSVAVIPEKIKPSHKNYETVQKEKSVTSNTSESEITPVAVETRETVRNPVTVPVPADSNTHVQEAASSPSATDSMKTDYVQNNLSKDSSLVNKTGHSKFSVSLFYTPNYIKNRMKAASPAGNKEIAEYRDREKSKYAFSAGLLLNYELTGHWKISTGGIYSTIAYEVTNPVVYANYGFDNTLNYQYSTSCGTIQIPNQGQTTIHAGDSLVIGSRGTETIKFINIPVELRYEISKGRFRIYGYAGVSANLRLQSVAVLTINNQETTIVNNCDGLKKMNYGYLFGAGIQYDFFDRVGIFLEPAYRGSLNSLTEKLSFNCYPYSFGLNVGINIHF